MEENKLKEILEKIKEVNKKKMRLKESYEEAKSEYGENSGIARLININLEKTEKEEKENLDNIYNQKLKLQEELKELEEKRKVLQIDKEYAESLIKTDEKNDDTKIDAIQIQRKDKFKELNDQIINVNNEISEKINIIEQIDNELNLFNYIENEKAVENNPNLKDEEISKDPQDSIIKDITKGIQNKLQEEVDLVKENNENDNIIDKKIMADKAKQMGNNIIKEMGQDYKNTYIYSVAKKEETPKIDDRKPEDPYKEGEELPKEQVEGLENIEKTKDNIKINTNESEGKQKDTNAKKPKEKPQRNILKIKLSKILKNFIDFLSITLDKIKLSREKAILRLQEYNDKIEDMPQEEYDLLNDTPLEELLNNMSKEKYSDSDLENIKDYANKYGEKDAKRRYKKQLSEAKITIDVEKIIKEREKKDKGSFIERYDNQDGHIERIAIEKIKKIEIVQGEIVPKGEYKYNSTDKKVVVDGEFSDIEKGTI